MKTTHQLLACTLLSSILLGCGGGSKEDLKRPARTLVSGTITLKGEPVAGATVTLHPVQGGNGAFGMTGAQGKFQLGTFEKADGVVPGDYKVSVKKLDAQASGKQPEPGEPGYDPNPKPEQPKHLLPEKYADPTKTDLTATISNVQKDDLNFNLE